jgi:hypothetical protein
LESNIERALGRGVKWTVDEDSKLKDAFQTHGGKNWSGIAALVPGRTKSQCHSRWKDVFANDRENGRRTKVKIMIGAKIPKTKTGANQQIL